MGCARGIRGARRWMCAVDSLHPEESDSMFACRCAAAEETVIPVELWKHGGGLPLILRYSLCACVPACACVPVWERAVPGSHYFKWLIFPGSVLSAPAEQRAQSYIFYFRLVLSASFPFYFFFLSNCHSPLLDEWRMLYGFLFSG